MPANEASFKRLVDVPVNYDRLSAPFGYGSKGKNRTFFCRTKLKNTLEKCFKELFELWGRDKPSIILTAGTMAMARMPMARVLHSTWTDSTGASRNS